MDLDRILDGLRPEPPGPDDGVADRHRCQLQALVGGSRSGDGAEGAVPALTLSASSDPSGRRHQPSAPGRSGGRRRLVVGVAAVVLGVVGLGLAVLWTQRDAPFVLESGGEGGDAAAPESTMANAPTSSAPPATTVLPPPFPTTEPPLPGYTCGTELPVALDIPASAGEPVVFTDLDPYITETVEAAEVPTGTVACDPGTAPDAPDPPDNVAGAGDGSVHATPAEALVALLAGPSAATLATSGYVELVAPDGSYVYGAPTPGRDRTAGYVTLVTVEPVTGGWTMTGFTASGC
jgi:hypothetical protein